MCRCLGLICVPLALQTARTACRSSSYIIDQMSSDVEVEDILLRTPTLQKLRTLDRLSTDAIDPETLQAAAAMVVSGSQVRQSRPRDRQQRRSFSPLLDSTERDHYSVCDCQSSCCCVSSLFMMQQNSHIPPLWIS